MKKVFFLTTLLLSLLYSSSYAQISSIESFDGKIYSIGDTILGGGSNINKYLYIKEFKDGKFLPGFSGDLEFNKFLITDITPARALQKTITDDTLAIVTNLEDNRTLYVSLKDGIRRKEIIAEPAVRLYPDAPMATISDFQISCIKTNDLPITDSKVKYYIKSIDKKLGDKCARDEFEYHEVKDKYKKEIEDRTENINFNQIYYFDQTMAIEEYDFDKKGFPVSFLKIEHKGFLEYGDFFFSIPNLESFSLFKIAPNKAKRTIKLRYGNRSHPSSAVYARCYFRFLDQKMEIKRREFETDLQNRYRNGIVGMELVGMEFYTERHANYNFLGSMNAE